MEGERSSHALWTRRTSNILEKFQASHSQLLRRWGRRRRTSRENIEKRFRGRQTRGGSSGMSHIAGDKYRARESRPKIPATSCGKGRTGSWKSFYCGRTAQSSDPFLPLPIPFPLAMCILHASLWNSAAVRKHAALVLLAKQIPIVRGGLKGIEGCIGVLFLRYRGFQEYEIRSSISRPS